MKLGVNMAIKEFIGLLYYRGINNKKILILGESFYCDEGCSKEYCKNHKKCENIFIKEFKRRSNGICNYQKTHSNISRLFCELINIKEKNFWKRVAYYNYIPYSIGKTHDVIPSKEDFSKNYNDFKHLIKRIRPNIIIALGKRLSNHIHDNNNDWKYLEQNNKTIGATIIYSTQTNIYIFLKKIKFVEIYHPSTKEFRQHYNDYKILFNDIL
jgi:hypothetical protein